MIVTAATGARRSPVFRHNLQIGGVPGLPSARVQSFRWTVSAITHTRGWKFTAISLFEETGIQALERVPQRIRNIRQVMLDSGDSASKLGNGSW